MLAAVHEWGMYYCRIDRGQYCIIMRHRREVARRRSFRLGNPLGASTRGCAVRVLVQPAIVPLRRRPLYCAPVLQLFAIVGRSRDGGVAGVAHGRKGGGGKAVGG